MLASFRFALVTALIGLAGSTASAQFGGGSLHGMRIAIGVDTPIGDFDQLATTGFGLSIHTGLGEGGEAWSGRGSFGFDRFGGKGTLDNVQFISYGFDIVHRSRPSWYQFGGITLNQTTYNYQSSSQAVQGAARNGSNFGFDGGIGVDFGSDGGTRTFVEFAATTLFTGTKNSSWFPVRFGLRF